MKENIVTEKEKVVVDMLLEAINTAGNEAKTGGEFTARSQAVINYERFIAAAERRANIKQ